ncbi:FAD binding domain-containing protein [Tissierella praeacuta]|uniref:FAD binding domain-containing protein n=1 Tax=Tissierella praeacuta TaxID=43131 RepID=UPI001C112034|nr:FAD binding domain-containing protein [Tissierella praeacuta]MBU5254619.1 FAD binding domain-containing protein [Tissierella praeacuta]
MIPFDFEYYKPDTIEDAIQLFNKLELDGKKPIYYGGGTEFISMARMYNKYTGAVIDVKGIPECNVFEFKNDNLIIGSAVTLTKIAEENPFPLLSLTVKRIADHTIQDKITLGGNLMGTIIYKEAILPLLLSNSEIVVQGDICKKTLKIMDLYDKKLQLADDEIIIQVIIDKKFLQLPYSHVKRTKNEKIDYPLITMAALNDNGKISVAFSGLCEHPIRSIDIEKILNNNSVSKDKRIRKSIDNIPYEILHDISGSSEYRKFILYGMLYELLNKFEEVS